MTHTEEITRGGTTFVVIRNDRGEIFHFKKGKVRRGLPWAPFNTIEEFTRPYHLMTLQNASNLIATTPQYLAEQVREGALPAIRKVWRYGNWHREAWLVDEKDVREWAARNVVEKHIGAVDWDIPALETLQR